MNASLAAAAPRYRVLGTVAKGGMAAIHLGMRMVEGEAPKLVAIKRLLSHVAADPDAAAMFIDEARVASRIVHPNVVGLLDIEMLGEDLVTVMDYVEGVPLSTLLRRARAMGPIPVPVVARVIHDALLGLHAAHEVRDERGTPLLVVHRDVSPQNLIVGIDGVTRVTDFGIALSAGRVGSTRIDGKVKGKLRYLSPEQVLRKPLDHRVDVFAAGIVLWEMLTGRRLFDAATEGEALAMVVRGHLELPGSVRAEIPLLLDETCMKALEREPDLRYASALEFAEALVSSVDGRLASRDEVTAFVGTHAQEELASRRSLVASAGRTGASFPLAIAMAATASPPAETEKTQKSSRRVLGTVGLVFASLVTGGAIVWAVTRAPASAGAVTSPTASPLSGAAEGGPVALPAASASPAQDVDASAEELEIDDIAPVASAKTISPAVAGRSSPRPRLPPRSNALPSEPDAGARRFRPADL